jgi:hypothetical protein
VAALVLVHPSEQIADAPLGPQLQFGSILLRLVGHLLLFQVALDGLGLITNSLGFHPPSGDFQEVFVGLLAQLLTPRASGVRKQGRVDHGIERLE